MGSVLALSLAAPAAAQRAPDGEAEQQLRYQLQTFEAVLQAAVRHGGDAFARQRAQFLPPGVQLTSYDPYVRGLAPPQGGGLLFYVAVPSIRIPISELLVQQPAGARPDLLQPASSPPRRAEGRAEAAGAQGLAAADAMTTSPVIDDGRCATRVKPSKGYSNPDYEYAVAVCDALMDAMLDNSGPLPISADDWLTVAAVNGEPDPPSFLNSSTAYTTYLVIKGSDLLAYRQGRLSKDEARRRVEMTQR